MSADHAKFNDTSQLKKENEYRSDFTDDIGLVNKSFVWIDLSVLDLMT